MAFIIRNFYPENKQLLRSYRKAMKYFQYLLITYFFIMTSFAYSVTGWHKKDFIDSGVHDYKVERDKKTGKVYVITQKLSAPFRENAPSKVLLNIVYYENGRRQSVTAHTINLKPAPALFPVNADIGVLGNRVLLTWQITDYNSGATLIQYKYSSNGVKGLTDPQNSVKNLNFSGVLVLPQIETDYSGNFYLFFQKERSVSQFTFYRARFSNGSFKDYDLLVKEMNFIGRGAFFPSVSVSGSKMHIFYQSRDRKSLKDDIFYFTVQGKDKSSVKKLTSNDFHDFSPRGILLKGGIQYVWQANPQKNWAIYISNMEDSRKLSDTNANCYNPQIAYSKSAGRIVTWYDHRSNPPQIFGIFRDRPENKEVGENHQITSERYASRKPFLLSSGSSIYLYYISGGVLYRQKADTDTSDLVIHSTTHREGKATSRNNAYFYWTHPKDPSGIQGYAYIIDKKPKTKPTLLNLSSLKKNLRIDYMKSGNYYLHINYKDKADNSSKTSHYNFIIDAGAPSAPDISSPSHKERVGSKKTTVIFNFLSKDDLEVAEYQYAFLPYATRNLKKTTTKNQLIFNNVQPGTYFFRIRAKDIAGNLSDFANYTVVIEPENAGTTFDLITNVADGEIRNNKIEFSIPYDETDKKKIQSIYLGIGKDPSDPYKNGSKINASKTSSTISFSKSISSLKKGETYIASVGVVYTDKGKASVKHIYFSRGEDIKNTVDEPKDDIASIAKGDDSYEEGEIYSFSPSLDKPPLEKPLPGIIVNPKEGYYEIQFFSPSYYKYKQRGYSWELSNQQKLPNTEINSTGNPEYLYYLKPGTYYINVRLILNDATLTQAGYYSSYKLIVEKPKKSMSYKSVIVYLSIILITWLVILFRRRIYYYISRWLRF